MAGDDAGVVTASVILDVVHESVAWAGTPGRLLVTVAAR